jgi:hypothetical protein
MTEAYENRIVNGILKANTGLLSPIDVQARLSKDVVVVCPSERSSRQDLWPCIWFLASVLQRQFTGRILLDVGLQHELYAPIPLGSRCHFIHTSEAPDVAVTIGLGTPTNYENVIWGDVRGGSISYGDLIDTSDEADPISCAALAGYLGFAALAHSAGIPPFHGWLSKPRLDLPICHSADLNISELAVLGLGQIGQAFLSVLFFKAASRKGHIHVLDRDVFEEENYFTQILLSEYKECWRGRDKTEYVATICDPWGFTITHEKAELAWGWKNAFQDNAIGFLGFDNMDARRMGVEGGFRWLVECGVGTDFCRPRVSWHSLPPDREIAKRFFTENFQPKTQVESDFARSLSNTPGGCGKVIFESIQASAPSLGILAATYAMMELSKALSSGGEVIAGGAYAWSPLLPLCRDVGTLR